MEGLTLYHNVISASFEKELITFVENTIIDGQKGHLLGNTFMQATYSDPIEKIKGKGRLVLQYGSFYDYASHEICPHILVEEMPLIFVKLIKSPNKSLICFVNQLFKNNSSSYFKFSGRESSAIISINGFK